MSGIGHGWHSGKICPDGPPLAGHGCRGVDPRDGRTLAAPVCVAIVAPLLDRPRAAPCTCGEHFIWGARLILSCWSACHLFPLADLVFVQKYIIYFLRVWWIFLITCVCWVKIWFDELLETYRIYQHFFLFLPLIQGNTNFVFNEYAVVIFSLSASHTQGKIFEYVKVLSLLNYIFSFLEECDR